MLDNLFSFISDHVIGFSILSLFILIVLCIIIFKIISHRRYHRSCMRRPPYEDRMPQMSRDASYRIPSNDKTSNEEIIKFIRINKDKENGVKK